MFCANYFSILMNFHSNKMMKFNLRSKCCLPMWLPLTLSLSVTGCVQAYLKDDSVYGMSFSSFIRNASQHISSVLECASQLKNLLECVLGRKPHE